MASRAFFEDIKTLGFASISGAYANVGTATAHEVRAFCITNNTAGDLYFSLDGVKDKFFVAAGAFKLWDVTANINPKDDKLPLPVGTQFAVKQITAPVSGAVYVECLY